MKNYYLLLFYLLPLVTIAQDAYLPFPTENAEWTVLHEQISNFDPRFLHNYHYVPDGDTLISDTVYTRLLRSDGKMFERETASYVGAYRNEGSQVLFIAKDSVDAVVLYDFSVQPGWILSKVDSDGSYYFQLESIDTILLNDQIPRRRYNFYFKSSFEEEPDYYHHSWIEGMGSTIGFFPDPAIFYMRFLPIDPTFSHTLLCYQENEQLLYTDSIYYKGTCYRDVTEELYPYQPMAVEGAHWIVASQRSGGLWLDWKVSLTIRGDTIVNGKKYKKLFDEAFYFDNVRKVHTNQIVGSNLYALLRDDTLSRKVYCIHINPTNETLPCPANEEVLLFDFSVEEGDTLDWCSLNWQNHYPKVDSIRFEAFDWTPDIQRKTLYTKLLWSIYGDLGTNTVAITEGIGYDIIGPFLRGSYLLDYCIGTDAQCGIITATKNIPLRDVFKIYPNPISDYILIEKEGNPFENGAMIRVVDQFGRVVLKQHHKAEVQQRVNTTNLPNGIFLVEIVDHEGVIQYREKIIKLKP